MEQGQRDRSITGVLRNLPTTGLTFLFQRLKLRGDHRQKLHDDGRRNVGHDAQREDREARQRASREHVKHAQDAAALRIEQLGQLHWVDSRHRNMGSDAEDNQCKHQENQATFQVAHFSDRC